MTDECCPYCLGERDPKDAGYGYVTWVCLDCGRVSREEVIERD